SHHEGMPISLLEALAHGLPIIATTVGAVPEVITPNQEGLLVPPHNPDLLAAAMGDLAGDPDRRARMSVAARCSAERRFGLGRLRDDLVRLYDAVCREPVASPIEARTALHAL
ncbi:MAG: glycosyltransferase, partial [Planctomycetes bacterium]|nr:glycosyltransferase [Planctomycetota bacterium]